MRQIVTGGIALLFLHLFSGCEEQKKAPVVPTVERDSVITLPDSTLYGRLGEGTGMSCLEFITENGDTLVLNKMSEYTGEYGNILGTIENYTDRFGIVTADNNQCVHVAVNINQLAQRWKSVENKKDGFQLNEDGTASPLSQTSPQYTAWRLYNGRLLLNVKVMGEYGEEIRTDSTTIVSLDPNTLVIRDHNNQIFKYYR